MEHLRINSAVNANLQNTMNTSLILHYVRNRGQTYRSEISRSLNLSLPAVSRAVDSLIERGYFIEKRIITSTGKQAHEVEINSGLGTSIGISIQPPYISIGKMDMAGNLIDIEEIVVQEESDGTTFHEQLITLMDHHLIDDRSEQQSPVAAVCLSVPAAVEKSQRKIYVSLYQSMKELNLREMLEKRYHIPSFLENNENLCVLAEKYYHEGIPEENVTYITIHHGIGAGLLINGQIYCGHNGAAGEIGQQFIGTTPIPGQQNIETFESLASIHQIQQIALQEIHKGRGEEVFRAASYKYQNISHIMVSELAEKGSADARSILTKYAEVLALGISTMLVTINPELVIIGGRICELINPEDFIIKPLKARLKKLLPFPVPKIRITRLGRNTAVVGACQFALENTILQEFPYIISTKTDT